MIRLKSRTTLAVSAFAIVALAASTSVVAVSSANAAVPSWCGPKKITMGFTDGFGGNSWRLVTTAAVREEIKLCPNVTKLYYADGQGKTDKSISDIKGMVAKGVKALVVFPDAGEAMLPALRSAYKAGVVTIPYRVWAGGTAGKDYTMWVGSDFVNSGKQWGTWIKKNLPDGGNILRISGPAGNSQGGDESKGLEAVLGTTGKYKFIGTAPFEPTGWDPGKTQEVLTAAIAKYPKIDVITSDFGPSLVSALQAAVDSGWKVPAIATSDGNVLACFYEDNKATQPDFKLMTVATQNDHSRLATQWAIALATGGKTPKAKIYPSNLFEDSVSGSPSPVTCRKDLPGDVYLSAKMSGDLQAKLKTN
ncbi:MAG: ribose ABC transporter substrate-binding protein [Actinobacteria bacterium]|nr:ribose ABC transporter substrate-binding protein [Candidatus Planktophila sp.]PHX69761.1 MAG: ribose ABC transporter substrate-binding protein [Actinomycetota bacterium]